jgi:hypothetical protein
VKLEFGWQTSLNPVLRDEPFKIGHIEADGAAHLYKRDSSLPDPTVERRRRDSQELGCFIYVYEFGWPSGCGGRFHG